MELYYIENCSFKFYIKNIDFMKKSTYNDIIVNLVLQLN